ncbi:aldose epimerase family protein [Pedosphaera parvula]|nr:aldose epimerase family protein [Pedosphaera parvula]
MRNIFRKINLCLLGALVSVVLAVSQSSATEQNGTTLRIEKSHFGTMPDGSEVSLYTLKNSKGITCKITDYGGIITEMDVPDRAGNVADVVLGYDDFERYQKNGPYFGAIVGRVANRVAGARFTLDGKTYNLANNDGTNQLHGGIKGFDKKLWKAEASSTKDAAVLKLSYTSPDGEENYPGNLSTVITYTLNNKNELRVDYRATTDKATPVNLSNHSYWNLLGSNSVLDHVLTLNADKYTPTGKTLIPTGEMAPVKDTPLDFTTPHTIGSGLSELSKKGRGYDNNFVLNSGGKKLAMAAKVYEPVTGRVMEVWTDQPGIQFYTPNFGEALQKTRSGPAFKGNCAFCLETENFPDAVNHTNFPNSILRPDQTYKQTTIYHFSTH